MKLPSHNFLQSPATCSLRSKYYPTKPVLTHPQSMFFP